jgi:uncharacterized membrane protein YccF (DUF307 family)
MTTDSKKDIPVSEQAQPNISVNVVNTATATATAGATALNHPSLPMRILWFCVIGWLAGSAWLIVAGLIACTIIGIPFSIAMLRYVSTAYWLGKVNW